MKSFYSNGKVLLSGEYTVLSGSIAVGLPTKMGQEMLVENNLSKTIVWSSYNKDLVKWFECVLDVKSLEIIKTNDKKICLRLVKILEQCRFFNPNFLKSGKKIITNLNFDQHWGLGTSSTLINNISRWAKINPYALLKKTFGGSGYDIACAQNNTPIIFSLRSGKENVIPVDFNPDFKKNLFFIYQNKKQNTLDSIKGFEDKKPLTKSIIKDISKICKSLILAKSLDEFRELMELHEKIISYVLKTDPIKNNFKDYDGSLKSLGAWGGDFFLAAGPDDTLDYFKKRNFKIGYRYEDFIL